MGVQDHIRTPNESLFNDVQNISARNLKNQSEACPNDFSTNEEFNKTNKTLIHKNDNETQLSDNGHTMTNEF